MNPDPNSLAWFIRRTFVASNEIRTIGNLVGQLNHIFYCLNRIDGHDKISTYKLSPSPDKTAGQEPLSCLCSFALFENEEL